AVDAAASAAQKVFAQSRRVRVRLEVVAETSQIEAQRLRVGDQVGRVESVLVLEEQVVHLPETALRTGRLCSLGRLVGVRVDLAQREVPVGKTQVALEQPL